jgi:hypothetical protein
MLVAWSIGEVSIAKSFAAESFVLPDMRGAASSAPDRALVNQPPIAAIKRDPFAGSFATPKPEATNTPAGGTALHPSDGGYDVPNLGATSGDKSSHVVLEGIVSGGAQSGATAIVRTDADTRLVHVGDEIGAWTIVSIDAGGITFNNGHRLTMDLSSFK